MKNRNRVSTYIFSYLLIVSLFAVLNWAVYRRDTTSFLISEQLNKHLIRYDLVSKDKILAESSIDSNGLRYVSLDDFIGVVASKLKRLSIINDSLMAYDSELESLLYQSDSLIRVAAANRDLASSTYLQLVIQPYERRLDSLAQVMARYDSTELIAKGLKIERANLELEYEVKKKAVIDHITENLRSFIPEHDLAQQDRCFSGFHSLTAEKRELELELNELVCDFRADVNRFHLNRSLSVGFFDFLYYSFCVSTTVSFGDIAPNNGLTRLIAVLELLSCIVLVSFILNRLPKGKEK